ncbi:hypothetical protein DSM101010T_33080 [Desulfovibrio subterraneus]|uniref:Uncharacterized protein n=1 Tax=Desulfovibrio subterraneus TaxID=2718620 RepID=A0A7J0BMD6_9BACT|nr:hypothetical protein DSM101010T_33080 [Desulfovibrio subterraneus]
MAEMRHGCRGLLCVSYGSPGHTHAEKVCDMAVALYGWYGELRQAKLCIF